MNLRKYGSYSMVTLASLGGESIIKSDNEDDQEEAREIITEFLDAGGILIDTSPAYSHGNKKRLSEKRFGEILPDRDRDDFIICTKTESRKKDGALKDLEGSLNALGLDYIDEWRLHHLDTIDELDKIFAKDGAIKAMEQAVDDGLVLRPSISGHSDPDVLLEALDRYPFKTVLGAINIADKYCYPFQADLIPYCEENDIPFVAMKLCSRGKLFKKGGITKFQDCFNYALSIPGVSTAIVGISNRKQLDALIKADEKFEELDKKERKKLEDKVEDYAIDALYFRKGQEWPDDVDIEDVPQEVR
jgi:aryl-alcohol dehydrogenase-like predicted oxidoreductase